MDRKMMESPPSSARPKSPSNREEVHQRMTTRSSPKTPSHPSNGYEILERRKSHSSVVAGRRSNNNSGPSRRLLVVAINNTDNSPDSIDTSNMELTLESSVKHSTTRSITDTTDNLAIAISQDDEEYFPDGAGRAKDDDAPISSNIANTAAAEQYLEVKNSSKITMRKRRQSSSTFETGKKSKGARRASSSLHPRNSEMTRMVVPPLDGEIYANDERGKACDSSAFRKIQHHVSEERDDDAILPSPDSKIIKTNPQDPSPLEDETVLPATQEEEVLPIQSSTSSSSEISVSQRGQEKLSRVLEKIASDAIASLPSDKHHVSLRKRKMGTRASLQESSDTENSLDGNNTSTSAMKKTRRNQRRETFELSKKRGVTTSAKRMESDICINEQVLKNEVNDPLNFVTPRAGQREMPWKHDVNDNENTIEENTVVMRNLEHLIHGAVEAKIAQLFPDNMSQIQNLPCVSARIFAAMSIVYENPDNFTTLLPLFQSLIEAEIVSLQNEEQHETVCFINKKVCFSGFDYSSTITAVGAVVGEGGGDLRRSIDALKAVLQHALTLPRPIYYLDGAIQCLHCMTLVDGVSECLSKTMLRYYFPTARFETAVAYYLNEMRDLKLYLESKSNLKVINEHTGIRNRLNDFIGRSIRYHLRRLLNSIPDSVVTFNAGECDERWGRAVGDRSISSILNFSLEKIHVFMTAYPNLIQYGVQSMPGMFAGDSSKRVFSMSIDELKEMDVSTYESLVIDITEARSFLFGARACSFLVALLNCPGVNEHVETSGGWAPVEDMANTLSELHLFEGSENEHFVQLREVRSLLFMLEEVDTKLKVIVEQCEFCIRRLRRKLNFMTKSTLVCGLKALLEGEMAEKFPLMMIP